MRLSRRPGVFAAAVVLAMMAALWTAFGVPVLDCFRYLIYLSLWIAMPGALLYRALRGPRPFGLEHICVGIPLGFVQMILGFILFSTLKMRMMIPAFPWISAAVCLWLLMRRRAAPSLSRDFAPTSRWGDFALAALCCASTMLMALHEFPSHPLPGREPFTTARYVDDLAWHIGNAAALKSFWPPRDFRVAGEALRYCIGDHIQVAANARVTGLEISAIMLRLDPLLMLNLLCLQFFWIGWKLSGDWRCGVLTSFLGLLSGDLSVLYRSGQAIFLNSFIPSLYSSPSFLFGLVVFIPAVVAIGECLEARSVVSRRHWAMLCLLLITCALSKATIVPVLAAALVIFMFARAVFPLTGALLLVCAASIIITSPLVVAPGSAEVFKFHPLEILRVGSAWKLLHVEHLGLSPLGYLVRAVLVLLGHAPAALLGFSAFVFKRRGRYAAFEFWALMVALAGAAFAWLTSAPGVSELYFWFYGYVPFIALSAVGLCGIFAGGGLWRKTAAALACTLIFLGTLSALTPPASQDPADPPAAAVEALLWVREHTAPDDVLAVNNARYFYYSGFSERQVLLENFIYTAPYRRATAYGGTLPYLDLRRLSYYIFARGDSGAIRAARSQFHVGYLLIDKREGFPRHALDENSARLIFTNQGMDVYRVVGRST